MALAAVDRGHFFGMRHLFDGAVTGNALQGGMGGRFQGRRIEARRHSGLAFPDARAGIVAAGTVFGMKLRRRLAAESGGQQGRNGRDPEEVRGRQVVEFLNNRPSRCRKIRHKDLLIVSRVEIFVKL
jgi:hypothetical protein